ncbi:Cilia- and flagella-associated protein 45 [Quaeritorhiza haematococci]|nr:Cilia- and flagella-associated protein 45 [Quaeritorhiza haematococci]
MKGAPAVVHTVFGPMVRNNGDKPITIITRDNIRTLRPHINTNEAPSRNTVTSIGSSFDPSSSFNNTSTKRRNARQRQLQPQQQPAQQQEQPSGGQQEGGKQQEGQAPKKYGRRAQVLNRGEFDRIMNMATVLSKEEIERRNQQHNAARLQAIQASKSRKAKMEEYDHKRTQNAKLSELEEEAKNKSNYLLAKAQMQLEEQEDDIKHLNELMLYAKCVAIRDSQVDEKKMIKREMQSEESRLDAMMEMERVSELKKIEERERKRIEELRRGAAKIRDQIEERREAAILDQEKKDHETKAILKAIADMNEQDRKEKLDKIKAQRAMMQEVAKANQESMELKRLQRLAEEQEDQKVLQYLLEKERREIENDKLQAAKKAEREKELARLRAAQEKRSDKQAQQDALRAQRAYEAYEREWRKKEKELAEKKAAQERELREDRHKQQQAREHAMAVEAYKLRQEFYDNLRRQKEMEEKIKMEEAKRAEKNKLYASEIKSQITEKFEDKRKDREEFFMEGIRLAKERKEKNQKIEQIKQRKVQELTNLGVPEKYCKEVARKVHLAV